MSDIYELPQPSRIPAIEGVRGLAITLVFFVHFHAGFSHYVDAGSWSYAFSHFSWSIGPAGVDLFFALSGYLVYGLVLRRPGNYLRFMGRRTERIYPTFLCVLAVYGALLFALPKAGKLPADASALYILANVALLPGVLNIPPIITVAWSLSYEWFFYASLPLLVGVLRMRRWSSWKRVFFIAAVSWAYVICDIGGRLSHTNFALFAAGMLLYELSHSSWFKSKLCRAGEVATLLTLPAAFLFVYFLQSRQSGLPPGTMLWDGSVVAVFYWAFFWLLVYAIIYDGILKRALSWTPLRWLGNISYSYYLLHGLVLNFLALSLKFFPRLSQHGYIVFWVALPLAFLATVGASTVLYLLVERRFSLQKKAVTTEPTTDQTTDQTTEPRLAIGAAT